ncbi:MAG: T9SS type A sorting domain-containing protein [Bacteroidota bacterium]
MKRKILLSLMVGFGLILFLSNCNKAYSQTDGTLTFTYTQAVPSGTSATKNVMAVWIEDNAGTFIKTKMRYWGSSTNDHLPSWVANSAQNVTDASTGATRTASTSPTAFGAKTITWDGKGAVSGTTAPDGIYKIMIESSYCNPEPSNGQHWLLTTFSFTKGATAVHLTPTGDANFSGITLDWVPASGTGIENVENNTGISIYPNPSSGIIKIDIQKALDGTIKIENMLGATVYEEKVNIAKSDIKTVDLSKFANGTYFVNVLSSNSTDVQKFKIVLDK